MVSDVPAALYMTRDCREKHEKRVVIGWFPPERVNVV